MGMEFTGRVLTQHGYGVYFQGTHPTWVKSVLVGYSPKMGMEFIFLGYSPHMGMECISRVLTQYGYGVY